MPNKCKDVLTSGHNPGSDLKKIFILDTNVLLYDPNALFAFQKVLVGVPYVVLEELDTFKRESGELGRNARETIRRLDELRSRGCLGVGVELNHNTQAVLKVLPTPNRDVMLENVESLKDNLIIQTAVNLVKEGFEVTLITKDINVRVKADFLGLDAEDYTKGAVSYDEFYKGWIRITVSAQDLRSITARRLSGIVSTESLHPNQFVILESDSNAHNYRLFRYMQDSTFQEVSNISLMQSFQAKNVQQLMALDLLMDDSIQLITLLGPAGTGKTFLTLLVGLYKVAYEKIYRKFLVTRPVVALGADIGYLPGDVQEKLHYWMQPIHDNLEFIFSQMMRGTEEHYNLGAQRKKDGKKDRRQHVQPNSLPHMESHSVERLQQKGILSLEAITYMRGRSIPYQFVFIDEVQNLTPHEVKTIVSRAGEGTKVILAGDPYQIDSPYLDFTSNGLTVTSEKFKNQTIAGTVFLEVSERSELAKLAAEIL